MRAQLDRLNLAYASHLADDSVTFEQEIGTRTRELLSRTLKAAEIVDAVVDGLRLAGMTVDVRAREGSLRTPVVASPRRSRDVSVG